MPFDWKEYQALGVFLREADDPSTSKEARLRSAVSRFYYSSFCHARNVARDRLMFTPVGDADDHTRLIEHFSRRRRMEEASTLRNLRLWRNQCDYQDDVANLDVLAENAETSSERIFALLR
jgi:hypothetical protein